jgi:hypothetical protein
VGTGAAGAGIVGTRFVASANGTIVDLLHTARFVAGANGTIVDLLQTARFAAGADGTIVDLLNLRLWYNLQAGITAARTASELSPLAKFLIGGALGGIANAGGQALHGERDWVHLTAGFGIGLVTGGLAALPSGIGELAITGGLTAGANSAASQAVSTHDVNRQTVGVEILVGMALGPIDPLAKFLGVEGELQRLILTGEGGIGAGECDLGNIPVSQPICPHR